MVQQEALHGGETPPPCHGAETAERSWWRSKRFWIPTLAVGILVLFGMIFGAVYGVKKAHSE